ncbi:hypothetical protein FACS1894207_1680 [Bacteroidia bacterium]|nr:hypothetical protein FACS1894207_1680 [Bacteroidia bacterium]
MEKSKSLLVLSLMWWCSGLFFCYHYIDKPKIKTVDDLLFLQGPLADYSFVYEINGRRSSTLYYIWLDNLPCTFQIPADWVDSFYQTAFENTVKIGDTIDINNRQKSKNPGVCRMELFVTHF